MKKLVLSDILKKDLRIVAFLVGSWVVGLGVVYLTKDEKLIGLVPVVNFIAYRLEQELKNEGYKRVLFK